MAIHHVTVTLTGANQAIVPQSGSTPTINCQWLRIENEASNADVKVGESDMTSTDYGAIVTSGATNGLILFSPFGENINLASTYLLGTQNQKVHCLYIQ